MVRFDFAGVRRYVCFALLVAGLLAGGSAFPDDAVTFSTVIAAEQDETCERIGSWTIIPAGVEFKLQKIGVVRIDDQESSYAVKARKSLFELADGISEPEPRIFVIEGNGKYLVEVMRFNSRTGAIYSDEGVIDLGDEVPDPDEDDDEDDEEDDPDPPVPDVDVANKMGVGKIAYRLAPRNDAKTLKQYQAIYKQAADFLYGIPTLKFVSSSNSAHASDPNRSVIAWLNQEYEKTQCEDEETCKAWERWRLGVADAINKGQASKSYLKNDWYDAFNEVSSALGAVK